MQSAKSFVRFIKHSERERDGVEKEREWVYFSIKCNGFLSYSNSSPTGWSGTSKKRAQVLTKLVQRDDASFQFSFSIAFDDELMRMIIICWQMQFDRNAWRLWNGIMIKWMWTCLFVRPNSMQQCCIIPLDCFNLNEISLNFISNKSSGQNLQFPASKWKIH